MAVGKTCDIAVVGATGLVGETLLDILAQRQFPAGKVYALASERSLGNDVQFGGRTLDVGNLADFDFSQVRIALFAASASAAAVYAEKAAAAGCVVVDNSAQFRDDDDVPLVIPEVNPQAIAYYRQRNIVASPNSLTIQMLVALKPLHDAAKITRINMTAYQAVSGSGRKAVEELAGQTAGLLNFKSIRTKVYPKQIAFNVLPQVGDFLDNGYAREEMQIVRETRKILDEPELRVNPTVAHVPVFFGHSTAMHIETERKLTAREARGILHDAPGVALLDGVDEYPTAVTEAVSSDLVYVGRIREDASHPSGLNLWVVADNVRKGAALNSVQIAELLLRDYIE